MKNCLRCGVEDATAPCTPERFAEAVESPYRTPTALAVLEYCEIVASSPYSKCADTRVMMTALRTYQVVRCKDPAPMDAFHSFGAIPSRTAPFLIEVGRFWVEKGGAHITAVPQRQ